jgi:GNAT superfamily N-acetyltransferase
MTMLTQSERLVVRNIQATDFEFIQRMLSSPEVMRYIRSPETDPEAVRSRIAYWQYYEAENTGLGVFMVKSRVFGQSLGYCVARHVDFKPGEDLEVGYVIAPEFAGKGYATELVLALSEYMFGTFHVPHIVAFTDPLNSASGRVLTKAGFVDSGSMQIYDGESTYWVKKGAMEYQNAPY